MKCEQNHEPNEATVAALNEAEMGREIMSVIAEAERDANESPEYIVGLFAAGNVMSELDRAGYKIVKDD